MDPGKLRFAGRTRGKVAGGFKVAPLCKVAVAEHVPGPERGDFGLEGPPQGCLGAGQIARGEEGRGGESEVVAGRRVLEGRRGDGLRQPGSAMPEAQRDSALSRRKERGGHVGV